MADWLKGFDPLKGVDAFGTKSNSGMTDGLKIGWKIGSAINKTIAGQKERRRMEEAAEQERQRIQDALDNPPPIHGSARWARVGDLQSAKLLFDSRAFDKPSSLLLGVFPDPELGGAVAGQVHWDGEGHLITVAPTRSGKSTTMIVPNLLRYRGACVVLDPKGELYRDTAAWRSTIGPVYKISPFEDDTDGFNPLSSIESFADARALASLLMPPDPKAQNFFRNDAIAFLAALIMFVATVAPPEFRTMQEIRNITAGPLNELTEFAEDMARSPDKAIANPAHTMLGKRKDGMATLRDTFNSELAVWDDAGVGRATTGTLDFKSLKDAPATVYITLPFDKMDAYKAFLKVVLTAALDAMVRNTHQPDIPVLFVLDEFLSLGPFPQFRDAIRTHAGSGVRLWFFLQDVATLEEHYPSSWKTFLNAAVKIFFGTNDGFTGQLVSEYFLGPTTVAHLTGGLSSSRSTSTGDVFDRNGNMSTSINASVNYSQRPLLTSTEVVGLLSSVNADQTRNGIVSLSTLPHPISLRMVPWYLGDICKSRVNTPARPHKP